MTILASKPLNTSQRNIKLEAKVLRIISVKNKVKNEVSTLDKI